MYSGASETEAYAPTFTLSCAQAGPAATNAARRAGSAARTTAGRRIWCMAGLAEVGVDRICRSTDLQSKIDFPGVFPDGPCTRAVPDRMARRADARRAWTLGVPARCGRPGRGRASPAARA